ncbi:TetR/AcrR family transcriptional regulator [Pendulispora rubella]|uniref:TetR/AcrR family transcriptional regulator n=1 Tax=Pendulispora rubella TaxID=2741070 RepID=A0ABZ2KZJ9_9BACT
MAATRGRPRSFDRDRALAQAMEVFWAKGYEGAQVSDLTAAMGINPPSFYAAFESKDALFREAVELYKKTAGAGTMEALEKGRTAREAIRTMLMTSVDIALSAPGKAGCLLVVSILQSATENGGLQEHMEDIRRNTVRAIRQRLERGVREGDLPESTDTRGLSAFFGTVIHGLSLQARDGTPRKDLHRAIEAAMVAL